MNEIERMQETIDFLEGYSNNLNLQLEATRKFYNSLNINVLSAYLKTQQIEHAVHADGQRNIWRGDADEAVLLKDGVHYLLAIITRNMSQNDVTTLGNYDVSMYMLQHHHKWIKPLVNYFQEQLGETVYALCGGGGQRQVFLTTRTHGYLVSAGFELVNEPSGRANNKIEYPDSFRVENRNITPLLRQSPPPYAWDTWDGEKSPNYRDINEDLDTHHKVVKVLPRTDKSYP